MGVEEPHQISRVGDAGEADRAGFLLKLDNAEMNTKFKSQGLVGKKIPKKLIEVGQGDSLCQKGKLDSTALLFTLRK